MRRFSSLFISCIFLTVGAIGQQQVYDLAGSYTFTTHSSVIELTVEAIGGGGGGGLVRGTSARRSGGGGGGAYAKGKILVTPSGNYNLYVGRGGKKERSDSDARHGEDSWFNSATSTDNTTVVRAMGGGTKMHNDGSSDSGAPGGKINSIIFESNITKPASVGNINIFEGGNGGSPDNNNRGGGGGGAAGSTGNGNTPPSTSNAAGIRGTGNLLSNNTPGDGGVGGISGGNDNGTTGNNYGGGGGGARKSGPSTNTNRNGLPGAQGIVAVYWSRIDNISTACQGAVSTTITGFNFSTTMNNGTPVTTTSVTLDGTPLTYIVNSNTQITIDLPVGATSGNVIVTTTLGRAQHSLTINTNTSSTAPASISGGGNYCFGNQVTLTANGGIPGTGAQYNWYSGSCGGTFIATTTTPVYTFTSNTAGTTDYFVRLEGTCNTTSCASAAVTLPSATGNLSADGESASCTVSGTGWIHFRNTASGRLLVAIDAQGENLGNVNATSYVQSAPITVSACNAPSLQTAVLGRRWVITPQNQPLNPVRVRLYFDNSEYLSLNTEANSNSNPQDNTAVFSDLHLSKYRNDGSPLVNSDPHDNCGSGITTIWTPQGSGNISSVFGGFDANGRYTEYTISDFSEFWLHGSLDLSPLAVTLSDFSVTCEKNAAKILWKTASEQNNSHFILERSRDGQNWSEVSSVTGAGNTNQTSEYEITDNPFSYEVYYRLQQVDFNGKQEIAGVRNLICNPSENKLVVYPNPAQELFTLEIHSNEKLNNGLIQLHDLTGKIIYTQQVDIPKGVYSAYFNNQALNQGRYIISVQTDSMKFKPVQLIIK